MFRRGLASLFVMLPACVGAPGDVVATNVDLLAADGADDLEVVEHRGARRLLRGAASIGAADTDERPTYRMLVETDRGRVEPEGRVLAGALVEDGVVWVTLAGDLLDGDGAVLDRGVIPELEVSADGRMLAYPHAAGEDAGVFVMERDLGAWPAPRHVTEGLALADRPLFLPDGRLVVVGAVASGIAGLWLVDPRGDAEPIPVTNATLRTGRPLGAAFVPPPAYHASMRAIGSTLVYDDGYRERSVALPVAELSSGSVR